MVELIKGGIYDDVLYRSEHDYARRKNARVSLLCPWFQLGKHETIRAEDGCAFTSKIEGVRISAPEINVLLQRSAETLHHLFLPNAVSKFIQSIIIDPTFYQLLP